MVTLTTVVTPRLFWTPLVLLLMVYSTKQHTDNTYTILARYGRWFTGMSSVSSPLTPPNLNGTDEETIHTYSDDTQRTDKRHIIATRPRRSIASTILLTLSISSSTRPPLMTPTWSSPLVS